MEGQGNILVSLDSLRIPEEVQSLLEESAMRALKNLHSRILPPSDSIHDDSSFGVNCMQCGAGPTEDDDKNNLSEEDAVHAALDVALKTVSLLRQKLVMLQNSQRDSHVSIINSIVVLEMNNFPSNVSTIYTFRYYFYARLFIDTNQYFYLLNFRINLNRQNNLHY